MKTLSISFPGAQLPVLALMLLFSANSVGHGTESTAVHHNNPVLLKAIPADEPYPTGKYTRTVVDYRIPDLALVAADGGATSMLTELDAGKPIMLNFVFTTCTAVCPVITATFSQVRDKLGREASALKMISISIDPEHDTPERLSSYAHRYHAGPEWRFLTGSLDNALLLQKAFDAYRGGKMSHLPVTFLRGSQDTSWIRLEGYASADDLLREYRTLTSQ
ncbi:MAG: SCO family protein [Gammaproteobacteria bacterium]